MAIQTTVQAAKAKNYKSGPRKPLQAHPAGLLLHQSNIGGICYAGPCEDGTRELYYFAEDGCTDGPHYTSEGCGS